MKGVALWSTELMGRLQGALAQSRCAVTSVLSRRQADFPQARGAVGPGSTSLVVCCTVRVAADVFFFASSPWLVRPWLLTWVSMGLAGEVEVPST